MENELTFSISDEQVEAVKKAIEALRELWEQIKEAVINAFNELHEKFVKPFIRHLFLLQLLEWKVPFWLARILQKITPFIWARGIGLRFWRARLCLN